MLVFTFCKTPKQKELSGLANFDTIQKIDELVNENIFDTLDKSKILTSLFESNEFDRFGYLIWKPNYYERFNNTISYDGNCHTSFDTILYFVDNKISRACIIFGTYNVFINNLSQNEDFGDCHFCGAQLGIALFSKTQDNNWELYYFEKKFANLGLFGTWKIENGWGGGRSYINIIYFGDEFPCIELKNGLGGNGGALEGNSFIYSLVKIPVKGYPILLSKIFEYEYYTELDYNAKKIVCETKLNLIKNNTNFYQISLKINNNDTISYVEYIYSEKYGIYLDKK